MEILLIKFLKTIIIIMYFAQDSHNMVLFYNSFQSFNNNIHSGHFELTFKVIHPQYLSFSSYTFFHYSRSCTSILFPLSFRKKSSILYSLYHTCSQQFFRVLMLKFLHDLSPSSFCPCTSFSSMVYFHSIYISSKDPNK